jgi:hypothetical protein
MVHNCETAKMCYLRETRLASTEGKRISASMVESMPPEVKRVKRKICPSPCNQRYLYSMSRYFRFIGGRVPVDGMIAYPSPSW